MRVWHRLSLEQKTFVIFAGFFLIASLNPLVVYFFQNRTSHDASVVAAWQKSATTTNHIFDLALSEGIAISGNKAQRHLKAYDKLLNTSRNGGIITDPGIHIKAAEEEENLFLEKINQSWTELKQSAEIIFQNQVTVPQGADKEFFNGENNNSGVTGNVQQINDPRILNARENINDLLPSWRAANNQYIDYLLEQNSKKKAAVTNASLIVWAFLIIALSIILFKVRNEIFTPLKEILATGEKISRGNYKARVEAMPAHELGHIGALFNKAADTLRSATAYIQALGQGNINNKPEIIEKADENIISGELNALQQQMQQIQQQEEKRKWISEGLTNFNNLLRTNNETIEKLIDKVTSALVKYTGSLVGGIYLLNDNEPPELELSALYALNTKKYLKRKFEPGEGLVGQTFLEEEYIYLLEIPANYISVTTGIGEASPKAILLMPLKVEEQVIGVIELASLREYFDHEIDFLKSVSESITATIKNVKTNERTKRLLKESQEMTEQMRSHEEEMRQNMEEFSATQEEMARKEQEITARLEAINNTLALAEYDMDKKIMYANKNFSLLHQHDEADLPEMHMINLIPESDEAFIELNNLWKELERGNVQQDIFRRINKAGKEFFTQSTFTPVKNGNGEIVKVIELSELSKGDNSEPDKRLIELEEMLRHNLEALDITQQKLNQKLEAVQKEYQSLNQYVVEIITDEQGKIKNASENLPALLGASIPSIVAFEGLEEDLFKKDNDSGTISYNNKKIRYIMKKMDNGSYLFLLMII